MIYAPVHTVGETGYLIPSPLQITHGREQGCLGVTDKAGSDSVVLGSMLRQLPGVSWQIVCLPNLVCTKYSEDCEDSDLAGVLFFFSQSMKSRFSSTRTWLAIKTYRENLLKWNFNMFCFNRNKWLSSDDYIQLSVKFYLVPDWFMEAMLIILAFFYYKIFFSPLMFCPCSQSVPCKILSLPLLLWSAG